jgi:hypothetical protein
VLKAAKRKWLTRALFVAAILAVLIALSFFVPIYGDICSKSEQTGHEQCASYHIVLVALWHILKATNDYGAAIAGLATVAVAVFTWTLYRATTEQGRMTVKSINLARDEFVSTHRPIIRVRDVFAMSPEAGKLMEVSFTISNVGGTRACIVESALMLLYSHPSVIALHPPSLGRQDVPNVALESGEFRRFTYRSPHHEWAVAQLGVEQGPMVGSPLRELPILSFIGQIVYTDDRGQVRRRTAFRRYFKGSAARWPTTGNPEEEYED